MPGQYGNGCCTGYLRCFRFYDISLQQLFPFVAVAVPRLTTSMSAFFILNSHGLTWSIDAQTQPTPRHKNNLTTYWISYKRIF